MATKQDTYVCSLITVCSKAKSGEKMLVDADRRFACPEERENCGAQKEKSGVGSTVPKWALAVLGGVILLSLALWLFYGRSADQTEVAPPPQGASVDQLATALTQVGNNEQLTVSERKKLVSPILKEYFSTEQTAYVKRVGAAGTIVETLTAEKYLNRLTGLISLTNVEIVKALEDSQGKIRELVVNEQHTTSFN